MKTNLPKDSDMKTGICIRPLVPVRSGDSERSEMVTQLLFFETVDVLEQQAGWSRIRNHADGYSGWVTSKMLLVADAAQLDFFGSCTCQLLAEPLTELRTDDGESLLLPAGSTVLFKDNYVLCPRNDGSLRFFQPVKKIQEENSTLTAQCFVTFAKRFMNAPYLWGGKSILGMDCSGLTQLSASLTGLQIPRDASQQVETGESVEWENAKAGDLAFFNNASGKVTHVGIMLGDGQILHASGYVHIDKIDQEGIFSAELQQYTHFLSGVRRLI